MYGPKYDPARESERPCRLDAVYMSLIDDERNGKKLKIR